MIEFKNTEQIQAGKAIEELRMRRGLSQADFARGATVGPDYLIRLEEGCEDKVSEAVVERILAVGGVRARGLKKEDLKRTLLSVRSPLPPRVERLS